MHRVERVDRVDRVEQTAGLVASQGPPFWLCIVAGQLLVISLGLCHRRFIRIVHRRDEQKVDYVLYVEKQCLVPTWYL